MPRLSSFKPLIAGLAAAAAATALAQPADVGLVYNRSIYQLLDPHPLASLAPGADAGWRIEAAAGLGERQQLRLSSAAWGYAMPFGSPRFDTRATWRYTVLESPRWAWRVGLTTPFGDRAYAVDNRGRFGTLPLLHVAGEGSLTRRWRVGFDADGLMTARGHTVEFGLRVSYLLAPNFSLTGGYRLSDAAGDGDDALAHGFSNAANVGLRYRF